MFLIVFWSSKQSKIEESSIESLAKQLEAHLHEEFKLWSFVVLCQKQIMNARRESKERNLTWRIQEDRNCWTLLEHFLDLIWCILYVVLKLGKSSIQHFKRFTNRSWNEEVRAIGSRSHQVEGQFRRLRNHKRMAAKSAFGYEMVSFRLRNFEAILYACEILLSASRYLRPTFLDFFASDIWCLNPHSLLVIHIS